MPYCFEILLLDQFPTGKFNLDQCRGVKVMFHFGGYCADGEETSWFLPIGQKILIGDGVEDAGLDLEEDTIT